MNALWAGTYSAFKALSVQLTPGEIVALRFTLAGFGMLACWPLFKGSIPHGTDLLKTAAMGIIVFTIGPRLQVLGVRLGNAGDSSVVAALEPLIIAVAAALCLRERVPARRWAGFGLGLVGVWLLNGGWHLEVRWPTLAANLVLFGAFVCDSAYSVIGKPILARAGVAKLVTVALWCGTLPNLLFDGPSTVVNLRLLTPHAWWIVAYLVVVCTLIGYSLWFIVIRETDVSRAALTILVQPLFGIVIAALSLGEPIHWGQLWGTVVILAGLVAGLSQRRGTGPGGLPAPDVV
jgi:drug/metabolite transporter (DMT)-like permease